MSHVKLKMLLREAQAMAAALPGNRATALVMTKLDEAEMWLDRSPMQPEDRVALEHFALEDNRHRLDKALTTGLVPDSHRALCFKQFRAMSEYAGALVERMDLFVEGRHP